MVLILFTADLGECLCSHLFMLWSYWTWKLVINGLHTFVWFFFTYLIGDNEFMIQIWTFENKKLKEFVQLRPCIMFFNMLIFHWGIVSPLADTQVQEPPLVGCLWLFIQYILQLLSIFGGLFLYLQLKRWHDMDMDMPWWQGAT